MKLLFGYIDKVGDVNKAEEAGKYRVRLVEDNIVTGWLFLIKQNAYKNNDDFSLDVDEAVAIGLCEDMRTGVIFGAINTQKKKPKTTDPDIRKFEFEDGSYISYDRGGHKYDIYVKGQGNEVNIKADSGQVNIECDKAVVKVTNGCEVQGDLKVSGDVNVTGKLDATGEISSSQDVTVGIIKLTTHKHPYTDDGAPATTQPPV